MFDLRRDHSVPSHFKNPNIISENDFKVRNVNLNSDFVAVDSKVSSFRKKRKRKMDKVFSPKKLKLGNEIEEKTHTGLNEFDFDTNDVNGSQCPQSPPYFEKDSAYEPRVIHPTRTIPLLKRPYVDILRNEVMNIKFKPKRKSKAVNLQFISDLLTSYMNSSCSSQDLEYISKNSSYFLENDPKTIFDGIIEVLKKTDECLDYNGKYSNSPRLPITIKKIILYLQGAGEKTVHLVSRFVEEFLFSTESHKHDLLLCMNLTHLYIGLLDLNYETDLKIKARLYLAKCLYFYTDFAYPMVHQLILAFPGILPYNGDLTYDRSDALISTIQCVLMNTYYANSTNQHLKMMKLFNLLTYRYKYQPMKPSKQDLIQNLISKIKAGKIKNVSLCFAIFCRRNDPNWNENMIIEPCLLPLLTEYYKILHITEVNDKKIVCLLETISLLIKPINITSDISNYLNIFSQFVSASVYRKSIQEAALFAIIRLSRFGYMNCYNVIKNLNRCEIPLEATTKAALKTFLYTKQIKA